MTAHDNGGSVNPPEPYRTPWGWVAPGVKDIGVGVGGSIRAVSPAEARAFAVALNNAATWLEQEQHRDAR